MNEAGNVEYHYDMVVNIVAEMVVEYLTTATRSVDEENAFLGAFDQPEGVQDDNSLITKVA